MAKKGDILLKCYNEFPEYYETYKNRLDELERAFWHAKNDQEDYLVEIRKEFSDKERLLTTKFYDIELLHNEKIKEIRDDFYNRFETLNTDITVHNDNTTDLYNDEDGVYQAILNQFEERKAEAFNTYLQLTKEANYQIDKEMKVHKNFIDAESKKLNAKDIEYQDLNSSLSNKLLWTMEKAKNALSKLSTTLNEEGNANKEFLDDTINLSILHLVQSKDNMNDLFKASSARFEHERNVIRSISKDKRKPHSEINQEMIKTFVKQIREVNKNRLQFEKMIKVELELSLSRLYPMIIQSDANKDDVDLRKYILQKEIIEEKASYLLERNKTMADLLISKYQNEIKKIKIDSFKRFEEIKLAYEAPIAFLQNSVNVYSNFAFYFNETYEDIHRILQNFKNYNTDYTKFKTDYIHNSQKSFEDYKINLLVKVNNLTNRLTEYISKIDGLSNEIVTLESNNRLEIAEIRKKMENLEIFGDYQKYIASLENDQYFAMHQHNNNIEKIQVESNYTNNLLSINKEVLLLNQNKIEYSEFQEYMIAVAEHEKVIHENAYIRKIEESKALYIQKADQITSLSALAKHKIIFSAHKTNYNYAKSYIDYLESEKQKNNLGSRTVIDFIHHAQELIDLNTVGTNKVSSYLSNTDDNYSYLRTLEKDRNELINQIDNTTEKKNMICNRAIDIYNDDIKAKAEAIRNVFITNKSLLKNHLSKNDVNLFEDNTSASCNGHLQEITAAIHYINNQIVNLAYQYQIPSVVKKIESVTNASLDEFVYQNITTYNKVNKSKSRESVKNTLKSYYLSSFMLLDKYEFKINNELDNILKTCVKNDELFIENTNIKANRTKALVNKEYEKLEDNAIKNNKSKKVHLASLNKRSKQINDIYKKQVKDINEDYLQKVKESDEIGVIIHKKFSKIISKNNLELKRMLKFLHKLFTKEQKQLNKQFEHFQKSLKTIEVKNVSNYTEEITYINSLYKDRDLDASKTIDILDNQITNLPVAKEKHYLNIKKEKNYLQKVKSKELNKRYAELEKDKFVSRPKYQQEIESVKNRLPDDYVRLYGEIQTLEFEYLNQFSTINREYDNNYNDYINNQTGNNEIIEPNSSLYGPFDNMREFYEKNLDDTTQAYKDIIQKSNKTREDLRKQESKSKETQDRIINV